MLDLTVRVPSDATASVAGSSTQDTDSTYAATGMRSRRAGSPVVSRTSIVKKFAIGAMVPVIAAMSLFGCQSAEDQALAAEAAKANAGTTNAPAAKSNWPKMVTVPAGSALHISLNSSLATNTNKTGDNFTARLSEHVRVDQMTVLPAGTEVRGRLIVVEEPHRTTGKAQMTLAFDQLVDPSGKLHSLSTSPVVLVAQGDKISDEEKVAAGAVIGGVIGALSSSKQRAKGAAVGAVAGAAAGGAIALATKGKQIELPAGQHFAVELDESIRVSVTQQTANR